METQQLGKTELEVGRLGVGLAEIGSLSMDQVFEVSKVLNTALDNGVTFLDTSACYGISEELIGQTVAHRRDEYVLATKCGHVAGDYEGEPWTAQTVTDSIDRSLRRMRTDHIDLIQLHSCDIDVLERGEVITALMDAQDAGKVRFLGYSGDNESAMWAVESGYFDTLQTSFNLVDQKARYALLPKAEAAGMGIIAKRPIANAVWGAVRAPSEYARPYFERAEAMRAMGSLPKAPDHRILLALGFTLAHDAIDTVIVGTRNPRHMQMNVEWVENDLPLASDTIEELHRRFDELGEDWVQKG
jgi:hypothetical protein